MNVVKMILPDIESKAFWIHHFGNYDETNYKNSPFYLHDYNLFHVERSYDDWVHLTAWAVYQFVWSKRVEREFTKVAPTLSHPVDDLVKAIRQLTTIIEEINK